MAKAFYMDLMSLQVATGYFIYYRPIIITYDPGLCVYTMLTVDKLCIYECGSW